MRKHFLYLTLLLATLFVPSVGKAFAFDGCCGGGCGWLDGVYVGVLGGANWLQNDHHRRRDTKFDTGYAVGGSIGYKFCNDFRIEEEVIYRNNQQRRHHGLFGSSSRHHRHSVSWMTNFLYDIDLCWCVKPYVGVGLGADWDKRDHRSGSSSDEESGSGRNHHRAHFAVQGIAGVLYPLCDCIDLSLDYHYLWASSHRQNHTLAAGVKYGF